jgi:hypothetical protein
MIKIRILEEGRVFQKTDSAMAKRARKYASAEALKAFRKAHLEKIRKAWNGLSLARKTSEEESQTIEEVCCSQQTSHESSTYGIHVKNKHVDVL